MQSEYFAHVVSTVSFAKLGTINTDQVLMTYKQRQAIRTLNYGTAVKVAIKFKTRWWEKNGLNQRGGVSYTDRQSRVVVYPSYGIGEDGPGVLMVTYNWCVGFPTPQRLHFVHIMLNRLCYTGIKTLLVLVLSSIILTGPNS
jgi:monoamine oxidase